MTKASLDLSNHTEVCNAIGKGLCIENEPWDIQFLDQRIKSIYNCLIDLSEEQNKVTDEEIDVYDEWPNCTG
jgi:hypothetical protein